LASAISALTGSSSADSSISAQSSTAAPSTELFLQLLVAQIKNQDPLNPTDSIQFVSQLAQFSQLEQVIAIRQGIDTIAGGVSSPSDTQTSSNT
jgi:flagellar basal-body rod modification protein FlgD